MSIELAEYRTRVADLYAAVRVTGPDQRTWSGWRRDRQELLTTHPWSALAQPGLGSWCEPPDFFANDPTWRLIGRFESALSDGSPNVWTHDGDDFPEVGTLAFDRAGEKCSLSLFWLDSYGGGLFLPFRDMTNGDTTFGAGRYVLDGAKGARTWGRAA